MRDYICKAIQAGQSVLDIGDIKLSILTTDTPPGGFPGGEKDFFMAKSAYYIDSYAKLTDGRQIDAVLELGIYKGGSVVFFDQFFKPKQLTALDLETARIDKLDAYVRDNASAHISLHYGVNQQDKVALSAIVAEDFPGGIDFVVDDASHFYAQTRASFEVIFPKVHPGGLYVIEDWSWGHTNPSDGGDNEDITRMLHQLIALHARRSDIISHIYLAPGFFSLTRGHAVLGEDFALAEAGGVRLPPPPPEPPVEVAAPPQPRWRGWRHFLGIN